MVISGGNFKPDTLKPKEVVSLLLDDEEIELKCKHIYRQLVACYLIWLQYILYTGLPSALDNVWCVCVFC